MVLSRGDDYPIHQTPEPVAFAGTDRNFYDRYFFNGYAPDGSGFFAVALGIYPHLDIIDAHFNVVRDGVQHCVHASAELGMERMAMAAGPIAWASARWHFALRAVSSLAFVSTAASLGRAESSIAPIASAMASTPPSPSALLLLPLRPVAVATVATDPPGGRTPPDGSQTNEAWGASCAKEPSSVMRWSSSKAQATVDCVGFVIVTAFDDTASPRYIALGKANAPGATSSLAKCPLPLKTQA